MYPIILIVIGLFLEFIAIYLQGTSLRSGFKNIVKSSIEDDRKNPEEFEKEKTDSIMDSSIKNKLGQKLEKTKDGGIIRRFTVENYNKLQNIIEDDQIENRIPKFAKKQKIIFLLISIGIIFQIVGIGWQQIQFIEIVKDLNEEVLLLKDEISELKLFIHVGE